MANRSNVNSLISQLSQAKKGTRLIGGNTTVTNLVTPLSSGSTSKSSALGRLSDIKASGVNGSIETRGIQLGSPSSTKSSPSATGSGWGKLLNQVASGGAATLFGNSLGSIGGLGSLISGIFHLFAGSSKATLPPLVRFQLPASQTETAYIGSQSRSVLPGTSSEQSIRSAAQPIYASLSTQKTGSSSTVTYDTAAITQAVKQALLNSSSLNDVIAEI